MKFMQEGQKRHDIGSGVNNRDVAVGMYVAAGQGDPAGGDDPDASEGSDGSEGSGDDNADNSGNQSGSQITCERWEGKCSLHFWVRLRSNR